STVTFRLASHHTLRDAPLQSHHSTAFPATFFFPDPATPEIYTLSLHDALPIFDLAVQVTDPQPHLEQVVGEVLGHLLGERGDQRSEEHTSELQSRGHLVCRLLLEKKKRCAKNWTQSSAWHLGTSPLAKSASTMT